MMTPSRNLCHASSPCSTALTSIPVTGATVTSINQAAAKMARTGILVIDGKVWRTVYYRFATREEREGKVSTNLIFKECRQSAAMKRVLAFYRGNFQ
ncbi:protein ren [Escherichia coli]|uniref:protein ren n=1 Tax=Escherichia coli TaxID=562 RepID=UPI003DA37EA7